MYFGYFPKGYYTLLNNGIPSQKIVTNLLKRIKVRSKVLNAASLYTLYNVPMNETPEITSLKHFGNTQYHWIILMTNSITDRYYGWPLSQDQFSNYLNAKYNNPYDVHHYEVTQSSGPTTGNGPSDYSTFLEVNSDYPGAISVTNYEYEQRLQDKLRQIKLLNTVYLPTLLNEFQNLIAS
jgi:hypothetical protein